jgi:phosphate transport system substrate-binding protein
MGRLNQRARRPDGPATATLLLSPSSRPREGPRFRWRPVLLAAAVLVLAHPPAAGAARTITLSGEPLTQRLVSDLAYFYRRETPGAPRFSIVGGGTAGGIADATRGIVDAGLVSRALVPTDPGNLVLTPIALSAICLVTNPANPLPNLTRAQIQDLVTERATTWGQIPGSPLTDAMVPVTFDEASGARLVFETVFLDVGTVPTYHPRTFTASTQMRDFIAATPGALGYLDVQYTATLHVVTYEGIACTRATVLAGTYPARRPLGFVTRGRPTGNLKRFLNWIERDRTAKRVIATRYVVPS